MTEIAAYADLIAATAVILSLCFVGYELHQTRVQSELSNWREILQAFTDFKAITNDLRYAEFLVRAHEDYDKLSEAEKLSFGLYLEQGVHISGNFIKHNDALPKKLKGLEGAIASTLRDLLSSKGGAVWWEEAQLRGRFMPDTYTTVNRLLAQPVSTSPK